MRGRLIFRFMAELARLDSQATFNAGGYDADFQEDALVDADGDALCDSQRREHALLRLPCQVEPKVFEALHMLAMGNSPESKIELLFHFRDLERQGLVDHATGNALIGPGDRLAAIYDTAGKLVQAMPTPLYAIEARPMGFGLCLSRPRRNLLLVRFAERAVAK